MQQLSNSVLFFPLCKLGTKDKGDWVYWLKLVAKDRARPVPPKAWVCHCTRFWTQQKGGQEAAEDKAHSPVHTPSPAGAAPPSLGAPSVSGCGAWRHLQSRQCHGGLPRACPVLVPADQGWAGRSWACGAMLYTPVPQRPLQPAPCAPAQLRKDCWLATALNRDALKECDNACDFMLTFF